MTSPSCASRSGCSSARSKCPASPSRSNLNSWKNFLKKIQKRNFFNSLVKLAEIDVELLQLVEQFVLVGPHVQLLAQLGNDQERPPATNLLRLKDVAEDVIADVENIFAFGADERCEHIARPAGVNLTLMQRSEISSDFECAGGRVDLTEDRSLAEEQRLLGVHHDDVEISFPIAVRVVGARAVWQVEQVRHDLVGELVVAVGEEKDVGARLADPVQHQRQARVLLHVEVEILDGLRLQLAVDVNPVDGVANILENRLERHEQLAALHAGLLPVILLRVDEEVDETRVHVRLGKIEQRVENVNARLVQLEKLIRVQLVNFGTETNAMKEIALIVIKMFFFLLLQKLKSMHAHENVSVGVDLQQVAEMRVEPQSADREGRVVVEKHDFWEKRKRFLHECFSGFPERRNLNIAKIKNDFN